MGLSKSWLTVLLLGQGIAGLPALPDSDRLGRRQLAVPLPQGLNPIQPATIEKLAPLLYPIAEREIVRYGPLKLRPAGAAHTDATLDPNGSAFSGVLEGLCKNCIILFGSTDLTYENGSHADIATGVYNHHVFIGNMGKTTPNPFNCSTENLPPLPGASTTPAAGSEAGGHSNGSESNMDSHSHSHSKRQFAGLTQIMGSGDDGTPIDYFVRKGNLKAGSYVSPTDRIIHSSEFVNYRKEEQSVYITIQYEYVPGRPEGYKDASMTSVSVLGCRGVAYYPPANKSTTMLSPSYTVTRAGTLYNMHAHLHDGGVDVSLYVNRMLVCTSTALYGGESGTLVLEGSEWRTIQNYTKCLDPVSVKKGDEVIVAATYDLIKHKLRPMASMGHGDHSSEGMVSDAGGAEAMGMLAIIFAADDSLPAANTSSTVMNATTGANAIRS
ncbi:hypothetical protein P152DRAFT_493004 [Eremomyces bilateralis CBS 781.70]|uniref:Uncharacterized protein n=1 Tax=Eremomyces bilateralis CBS 781.70 TaxID=1392243 RepID=A0A6G1GEQ7_9PEZI|nr:uncharacterized protein P152DRAFT_493004 [Eremomyces bilateralis CBS 781.70]KAF1816595.1 hypothetical protein P152DRAFT_493004 [Eremomyces bilateralis CBS 781.70]